MPAVAVAADNGEIFHSSTWTIPGTVQFDGPAVEPRSARMWHVTFGAPVESAPALELPSSLAPAAQRPQAVVYSDGYNTRRKIHMAASWATIPLFVGQYITGQKLYDGNASESVQSAHGAFAAGVAALFAVNTATGVWNLWEARHDSNGQTRRLVHGLMMLGADAGFVAAGMMAPDDDEGGSSGRAAHRNVAITSFGLAAASYIYMLVTR
jgi:hypothetical protein